jgi:hypothetical protein
MAMFVLFPPEDVPIDPTIPLPPQLVDDPPPDGSPPNNGSDGEATEVGKKRKRCWIFGSGKLNSG